MRLVVRGRTAFAALLLAGATAFIGVATPASEAGAATFPGLISSAAPDPIGAGYWDVYQDGTVVGEGGAPNFGDMSGQSLNAPMIQIAPTSDGGGYWLLGADGGIFSFGDAQFYGSEGGQRLNRPVVGIASTADSGGYWEVASDGGIFTFGDAPFYGSTGAMHLNAPVVGMATTSDGRGYWLLASDGGIFTFGDAQFYGSDPGEGIMTPASGIVPSSGGGYTVILVDGGIESYSSTTGPNNDISAFVGFWYLHAGGLTINADGSAQMTYPLYGAGPDLSPLFPILTLDLTGSGSIAEAYVVSSTDPSVPSGTTFTLMLAYPGIVLSNEPANLATNGVTVFCDPTEAAQDVCGA
jgi:TM2 domain-containing membrane protein YozV